MIIEAFKEGDKIPMWVEPCDAGAIEPNKPVKKKLTKHEIDGKDKKEDN